MKRFSMSLVLIFLIVIGVLVALSKLPIFIGANYFVLSLLIFFLYWKDKRAARNDTWRVSEKTLHLVALFGGWPGSLIGQQSLRHKTQKVSFRIVLWLTVVANLALLFYKLWSAGKLPFLN